MGELAGAPACELPAIGACSPTMHRNLKRLWIGGAGASLLMAGLAQAQTSPSALPRPDQISPAYSSTWLLLDPCHDFAKEVREDNVGAEILEDQKKALAIFPQGVCARAGMAEKLFQSRFLQYAVPVRVAQPWLLWPQILQQQSRMKACRTLDCLEHELDASVAQLKPLYLARKSEAKARPAASLCSTAMQTLPVSKALQMLPPGERKSVLKVMGSPKELQVQTCIGKGETLLSLSALMSGNQVNGSEWLYQLSSAGQARRLLYADDGPVMALQGTCAGRADLMTSGRLSAGEHELSFYRFDGRQYQPLMSLMEEAVAADEQSGDWSIARYVEYKPVRCTP